MFWLKEQLSEKSDRKFVLLCHVYGGARYKDHTMWNSYPNKVYFELIHHYKDKIIIELAGDDNFTSTRYHTDADILDTSERSNAVATMYHNMLVLPSMTAWNQSNPAISYMEIANDTLIPHSLRSHFLNIRPTMNKRWTTPFKQLEFRTLDLAKDFDCKDLTPKSIDLFRKRIQEDTDLQVDYMVKKIGFDPAVGAEKKTAFEIFEQKGLAKKLKDVPLTYSTWAQICLMTKNINTVEYATCIAKDPTMFVRQMHTNESDEYLYDDYYPYLQ